MRTLRFILVLLFLLSGVIVVRAQEKGSKKIKVSGLVTDSDDNPVKGVYIFVDSIKTQIKTNKKGLYKIKLSQKNTIITVFSKNHGMLSKGYAGQVNVNFVFPKNNEILTEEELVDLGYSIPIIARDGEIIFEDEQSVTNYSNIYQMINAKFPGVSIIGENISIRGAENSSFSGNAQPLLLVNKSAVGSISSIPPTDVRSIRIIKGPDAARYGVRGANGVILITLK